jgi:predicted RNase H-like HicB family nuclease
MAKVTKKQVQEYTAVFQEETDGGYSVWIPDLPGCTSQGETFEEALANIKEATELYLDEATGKATTEDLNYRKQFVLPVRVYA